MEGKAIHIFEKKGSLSNSLNQAGATGSVMWSQKCKLKKKVETYVVFFLNGHGQSAPIMMMMMLLKKTMQDQHFIIVDNGLVYHVKPSVPSAQLKRRALTVSRFLWVILLDP
jgi:hypothetical protein